MMGDDNKTTGRRAELARIYLRLSEPGFRRGMDTISTMLPLTVRLLLRSLDLTPMWEAMVPIVCEALDEDDLAQAIAWMESPTSKRVTAMGPAIQKAAEESTRVLCETALRELGETL